MGVLIATWIVTFISNWITKIYFSGLHILTISQGKIFFLNVFYDRFLEESKFLYKIWPHKFFSKNGELDIALKRRTL